MKIVPEQVARWIPGSFTALGTDGYGRSDTRAALRRHFEVDAAHLVVAVLHALGKAEEVAEAIATYGIDPEAIDPRVA
jgi:pyruvate dehydrogenase E1 component